MHRERIPTEKSWQVGMDSPRKGQFSGNAGLERTHQFETELIF